MEKTLAPLPKLDEILGQWVLLPNTIPLLSSLLDMPLPVNAAYLGSIHNISQRQVLYCVHRDLFRIVEKLGLHLICKNRIGIFIDGSPIIKRKIHLYLQNIVSPVHSKKPVERQHEILAMLLRGKRSLSLDSLGTIFNLSPNTLLYDIQKVKSFARNQGVTISWNRKQNYHPSGSEIDIRKLYIHCITAVFPPFKLGGLCQQSSLRVQDKANDIHGNFHRLFSPNLRKIWEVLNRCSRTYKLELSDRSLIEMVLYIDIMQDAITEGYLMDRTPQETPDNYDFFVTVSNDIAFSINLSQENQFQKNEIACLAREFAGLISHPNFAKSNRSVMIENKPSEFENIIADDIASFAAKYLHPQFHVDENLKKGLARSFVEFYNYKNRNTAVNRQQHSEIKHLYPYIYRTSSLCSDTLENKYDLSIQEELRMVICKHLIAALDRATTSKSITQDVVLICNDETDAVLMESRLQREYPQLVIRKTIRREELSRTDDSLLSADLVITNVKIPFLESKAAVISPLITETDKRTINKFLLPEMRDITEPDQDLGRLPSLADLLTSDNIQSIESIKDWKAAVIESTSILIQKNLIEGTYRNAIIDGIEKFGPYMVIWPGVALLHAKSSDGAKKLAIAITIIKKGVNFGSILNDPVQICIALSTVDGVTHLRVLQEFNYIFGRSEDVVKEFINYPIHKIVAKVREYCRGFNIETIT